MSSSSFGNRRQIWSNRHHYYTSSHPLRKQRSFSGSVIITAASTGAADSDTNSSNYDNCGKLLKSDKNNNETNNKSNDTKSVITHNPRISSCTGYRSNSTIIANNNDINITTVNSSNYRNLSRRGKYSLLQKQLSVDQVYTKLSRINNSKFNVISTGINSNTTNVSSSSSSKSNIHQAGKSKNFYISKNSGSKQNRQDKNAKNESEIIVTPELCVSSFTKSKTANFVEGKGHGEVRKDKTACSGDRLLRKSPKRSDDRINLNIFLRQTIIRNENDEISSSDVDSESESLEIEDKQQSDEGIKKTRQPIKKTTKSTVGNSVNNIHNNANINNNNNNNNKNNNSNNNNNNSNSNNNSNTVSNKINQQAQLISTAAARRAQFQKSRAIDSFTSYNSPITGTSLTPPGSAHIISASPSLIVERRPPLVRAMSAPVRTLDENSKNILANKRKSRRRRLIATANHNTNTNNNNSSNRRTTVINSSNNSNTIIESSNNIRDNEDNKCGNNNNSKKNLNQAKITNFSCDVVTLVSLISSEGSDSEKEDTVSPINSGSGNSVKRPPLLRKTGKSVSFQEDDSPSRNFTGQQNQSKEISNVLRRGSIAPFAARLRLNRPPTAPPVSIFFNNYDNSSTTIKMSAEDTKSSIKSNQEQQQKQVASPNSSGNKENESDVNIEENSENQFPEYVKSKKERECWKLFQKMLTKGVAVSYDTVLRGMLTPTELRIIQKQKELDEAKKIAQAEADTETDPASVPVDTVVEEKEKTP